MLSKAVLFAAMAAGASGYVTSPMVTTYVTPRRPFFDCFRCPSMLFSRPNIICLDVWSGFLHILLVTCVEMHLSIVLLHIGVF